MNHKIKTYLDYIPFCILLVSAIILLWKIYTGDILLMWKHYTGLVFLVLTAIMFFVKHLCGVLSIGLTLILGLFGILSFSPAITTTYVGPGNSSDGVSVLGFQPIFILWLIIYFILSGRHFTGILSKSYWEKR